MPFLKWWARVTHTASVGLWSTPKHGKNLWILHHGNVPTHKFIIMAELSDKNSAITIEQSLHSPDMASADFFLIRRHQLPIWGTRFQLLADLKENSPHMFKKRFRGFDFPKYSLPQLYYFEWVWICFDLFRVLSWQNLFWFLTYNAVHLFHSNETTKTVLCTIIKGIL